MHAEFIFVVFRLITSGRFSTIHLEEEESYCILFKLNKHSISCNLVTDWKQYSSGIWVKLDSDNDDIIYRKLPYISDYTLWYSIFIWYSNHYGTNLLQSDAETAFDTICSGYTTELC